VAILESMRHQPASAVQRQQPRVKDASVFHIVNDNPDDLGAPPFATLIQHLVAFLAKRAHNLSTSEDGCKGKEPERVVDLAQEADQKEASATLQAVDYEEWCAQIAEDATNPLHPLVPFIEQAFPEGGHFDNSNTRQLLHQQSQRQRSAPDEGGSQIDRGEGLRSPAITQELANLYFDFLTSYHHSRLPK
jgi:hypothetical protein